MYEIKTNDGVAALREQVSELAAELQKREV